MTEGKDTGTTGAALDAGAVRVRVEYDAPSPHVEECDPADFEDCATEDEVLIRVVEWTEQGASVFPNESDIAALWAAVQALRERDI